MSTRPARPVPAADHQRGITLGPEHTRIPNQLLDMVYPRLNHGQSACLLYIVRRTYGFASATVKGQRKQWDRISLSQFIDGTSSAGYVLDLGTGLSRASVIRALGELEDMELVRVSYECPTVITKTKTVGCGWNQSDDDHLETPTFDERTNAYKCPRCSRTLSKTYALRTLTPGFIVRFLNKTDRKGVEWSFDPEVGRFCPKSADREAAAAAREEAQQTVRARAAALREQLWFPDMVEEMIGHAVSRLKNKKMSESRVVSGFLEPIIAMQETVPRNALQYGLSEAVRRKVAGGPGTDQRWQNYVKTCARSHVEKNAGGKEQADRAGAQVAVETLLERCAQLNQAGEREQARQQLHDLLAAHLDKVSEEFGSDRALARRHLLETFKRGLTDYVFVLDYTVLTDYLPDFDWDADEARGG